MSDLDSLWIFLALIWAFYLGTRVGRWITVQRIIQGLSQDPDQLLAALSQYQQTLADVRASSKSGEELAVERHGDQLYVYAKPSGEFLAQGATLQECLDTISRRYPGRAFQGHLSSESAEELGVKVK